MKAIIAKSWPLVLLVLVVVAVAGCAAAGPGGAAVGGVAGSVLAIVLTIVGATLGGIAATGCTSVSGRACEVDSDDDGACADEDCNDADPTVFPGAAEARCDDGIDQDCDGNDGGDDARCMPPTTPPTPPTPPPPPPEPPQVSMNTCADADGDGYGYGFCPGIDCDDSDPSIHPGALDSACDSIDSDCDPSGPEVSCNPMPEDICCDHIDGDGDGRDDPRGVACNCCYDDDGDGFGVGLCGTEQDCNDSDAAVFPGNTHESSLTAPDAYLWCSDGKDNDCDGMIDWADPQCPVINGMLDDVPAIGAEPDVAWPPATDDDDGSSRPA